MAHLQDIRASIADAHLADEQSILAALIDGASIDARMRRRMSGRAEGLVTGIRTDETPGLMEVFLAEYGLSTNEGVALMCLAEALLRVPDAPTIDDLIEDKIAPSSWGQHLGHSSSSLVNASTWALMLTGKVLDEENAMGIAGTLHGAVKRLGEPVIRTAVRRAMKEMGNQFVLGETIDEATRRGRAWEDEGYTYSYDMLGEAALTAADAQAYFKAYKDAILSLRPQCTSTDIRENPGISIKLSALHPRYEVGQRARVMRELVGDVVALAVLAKDGNMGLNVDAEEADRLDLSLDVIEAVLRTPDLADWDGFGVVVQAYGKRAAYVLDWLYELATDIDRKIMVRLVKGAYWDTEIKLAQVEGLADFPVFTRKSATDVSYLCCSKKLLGMTDRIYPQFATHNAHTVAAIQELADAGQPFEFQRLHGMGEALHNIVMDGGNSRCRIYAPVGAHRDLLAYLVRRLLENGANSSFVNQIVDESVPADRVAADPFDTLAGDPSGNRPAIVRPTDLFQPERPNSRGWDLRNDRDLAEIDSARNPFFSSTWHAEPLIAGALSGADECQTLCPADPSDVLGTVVDASPDDVETALSAATRWNVTPAERAAILSRTADLYEENFGELFAVLAREAGKIQLDTVAELREAVDFLRYYATEAERLADREARGVFACISPWNFPLAIFTGQISAALAAGNGVIAKPAEQTPITANIAIKLMHEAGVPRNVLQLLPGTGAVVGAALSSDPRISGICFTGSTETAQIINRSMAEGIDPMAPLIAETGGLNAMIVDSTALPEQAIKDILVSSFQSAGQRCSALRLLYLQEDISDGFLEMLFGAIDELVIGNPWEIATDIGPVIDAEAQADIQGHIDEARRDGRLMKYVKPPTAGTFVGPAVIEVAGIGDLEREIFGPVLHVAKFKAADIDKIISNINESGYGLTFGLHSRIDDRVEHITSSLNVGNIYINRNQIGAIVGSQPFGGEGMSGTGPKAGGPHYVGRFTKVEAKNVETPDRNRIDGLTAQAVIDAAPMPNRVKLETADLPGPTGESNRLSVFARGRVLCLGPSDEDAQEQAEVVSGVGAIPVVFDGRLDANALATLTGFDAIVLWGGAEQLRAARRALAKRSGPLIPLITDAEFKDRLVLERHVCIDTTAAGGNASLLAASG